MHGVQSHPWGIAVPALLPLYIPGALSVPCVNHSFSRGMARPEATGWSRVCLHETSYFWESFQLDFHNCLATLRSFILTYPLPLLPAFLIWGWGGGEDLVNPNMGWVNMGWKISKLHTTGSTLDAVCMWYERTAKGWKIRLKADWRDAWAQ